MPPKPTGPAPHPRPLGHLSLPITSHPASRAFYTAALAPLGLHLVYDSEDPPPAPSPPPTDTDPETKKRRIKTLGYGPSPLCEILNLFEYPDQKGGQDQKGLGGKVGKVGFHVAFNAPSREAVVEFHRAAVAAGGRDDGAPGVREGYGRGYFAAFVVDLDGWRVEAVCKGDPSGGGADEGDGEGGEERVVGGQVEEGAVAMQMGKTG